MVSCLQCTPMDRKEEFIYIYNHVTKCMGREKGIGEVELYL